MESFLFIALGWYFLQLIIGTILFRIIRKIDKPSRGLQFTPESMPRGISNSKLQFVTKEEAKKLPNRLCFVEKGAQKRNIVFQKRVRKND